MISERKLYLIMGSLILAAYISLAFHPLIILFTMAVVIGSIPLLSTFRRVHPTHLMMISMASLGLVGVLVAEFLDKGKVAKLVSMEMLAFYAIVLTLHFVAVKRSMKQYTEPEMTWKQLCLFFFMIEAFEIVVVSILVASVLLMFHLIGPELTYYAVMGIGMLNILLVLILLNKLFRQKPATEKERELTS